MKSELLSSLVLLFSTTIKLTTVVTFAF